MDGIALTGTARVDLLVSAARSVYGVDWHQPLARELRINYRTIKRWEKGELPIPAGVLGELPRLLREEADRLERLAQTIALVAQS